MKYPPSDHCDGSRFFNPLVPNEVKGIFDILKWKMTGNPRPWPKDRIVPKRGDLPRVILPKEAHITFINHATFLIQTEQLNIITDPVFAERASPFRWIGPKRYQPPGLLLHELPRIDVVLVSHNHYDHMDIKSLQALGKKESPLFIVPLGNRALLEKAGIKNVIELDWWENHTVSGAAFTLTPSRHWSARGVFDRYKALWGSFMIDAACLKIYFGGDTAYGPHFKKIHSSLGPPHLSLLPIGAYEPRWFMQDSHMNPAEAVQAHKDLESRRSLGMHFGTFRLTDEAIDDPIVELQQSLAHHGLDPSCFLALPNGSMVNTKAHDQ